MNKLLLAASLIAPLALAGCVQPPPGPNPFLQAQIGKSEIDLVRSLGVPSASHEVGNVKFDAYVNSYQWVDNFGGRRWGFNDAQINTVSCETDFELTDGHVTGYILHGSC